MTAPVWGATPDDWAALEALDLTEDLLPVVSRPDAPISPGSSMATKGKTPSDYNAAGNVRGISDWTQKLSTAEEVTAWSRQPDYGICLQTRRVRGIDVDIGDADLAADVLQTITHTLGLQLPKRSRANSAKFLCPVRVAGIMAKRVIVTTHGAIEFLATGQQFIAVGTHPSGAKYEWGVGLPTEIPEITAEEFEDLWSTLHMLYAITDSTVGSTTARKREARIDVDDPLANHLAERRLVLRTKRNGGLLVACPWAAQHSSGTAGDTSTVYFPAGTNGYRTGNFKCQHGHCGARTTGQFAEAVGYDGPLAGESSADDDFGAFDDEPPVNPTPPGVDSGGSVAAADSTAVDVEERVFDPFDYPEIASAIWRVKFGGPDNSTLRKWNGEWYEYTGTHYDELDDDTLGVKVHRFLANSQRFGPMVEGVRSAPVAFKPKKSAIEETLVALRSLTHLRTETAPAWDTRARRDPVFAGLAAADIVSLGNGLFHLPTRTLLPHTPALFSLNTLPFDYDPSAKCGEWEQFLENVWEDDQEMKDTLQDVFGYLLTNDTSLHKIPFIVGAKRGGKGTIGRVIEGLIGRSNVAGPTLQSLSTQFGLAPLIGKQVAIIGDGRSGGRDIQVTVERLLMISGGDKISIDRKNREAWDGRLSARIVVMSNELLMLPDSSGALASRMLLLKLTKSFLGQEDVGIGGRILAQLPGVFNWALAGRDRLLARGHFIQPAQSMGEVDSLRLLNSPVTAFVEEQCEVGPNLTASKHALYMAYTRYCETEGRHVEPKAVLMKSLFSAYPSLRSARARAEGSREQRVGGLRLTSGEWESGVFDEPDLVSA